MSERSVHRYDIDGLRSVAVLAVVLFHVVGWPTGGFVGVDVFFVLSGYLITGILHREWVQGRFSYARFYERRIRRILPALMVLLAVETAVALWLFVPEDLADYGAGLAGAGAFASNVVFWLKADYFAGSSELNALLHTWSLAVEEQYYLLFPPLLMLTERLAKGRVAAALALAGAVSLGISALGVHLAPSAAFYLIPSRAWELLVGALLAVGPPSTSMGSRRAEVLAGAGAAAVAWSCLGLSESSPFPGADALPACLGTAALLYAGTRHDTVVTRALSLPPMVFVGRISYSLYLWHWPILVFVRYATMQEPSALGNAAILVASLAAASASYRWVETPFRKATGPKVLLSGAFATILPIVTGAALWGAHGLPWRFSGFTAPSRAEQLVDDRCLLREDQTWKEWGGEDACRLTRGPGPRVLLWGDSHANHLRFGLQALEAPSSTVYLYSTTGCAPVLGVAVPQRPTCEDNNAHVLDLVRELGVIKVVLAGDWWFPLQDGTFRPEDVAATVRALQGLGVEVAIVGQVPVYGLRNPQLLAYRLHERGISDYWMKPDHGPGVTAALQAATGVRVFDPMSVLCEGDRCRVVSGGELMVVDRAHLAPAASIELVRACRTLFE